VSFDPCALDACSLFVEPRLYPPELLMVIAIIVILAAMLLPVLTNAKLRAHGISCMNNHRQLALAWRMYSDDNNDILLYPSRHYEPIPNQPSIPWITGDLDFDLNNRANWNPDVDLKKSPLWTYSEHFSIS
jgi:type II secretory pathway pseudopilin PulG